MKLCGVLLVLLVFSGTIVICFSAEEVSTTDSNVGIGHEKLSSSNDSTTAKPEESKSVVNPSKVEQEKKGENQKVMPQGENKNDPGMTSSTKDTNSKLVPKVDASDGGPSKESLGKKRGVEKEGSKSGSESKPKEFNKDGDSVSSKPLIKESTPSEECGASNKCIDEKNKLIACLRVPGNESPDLSLLIQNKGKIPLTVKILAPDFVHLEKSTVHFDDKKDKKMKVSIGKGNYDTKITLKAGDGNCSIDFRDLISHYSDKEDQYITKSSFTSILTKAPSVVFAYMFIGALLLIASAWMSVRFRRKHLIAGSPTYQKLETELPVSSAGKTESDVTDGWDNSWGDSWDDEEAPRTPSKPITPSSSSKRIASRRLSKDGWKD